MVDETSTGDSTREGLDDILPNLGGLPNTPIINPFEAGALELELHNSGKHTDKTTILKTSRNSIFIGTYVKLGTIDDSFVTGFLVDKENSISGQNSLFYLERGVDFNVHGVNRSVIVLANIFDFRIPKSTTESSVYLVFEYGTARVVQDEHHKDIARGIHKITYSNGFEIETTPLSSKPFIQGVVRDEVLGSFAYFGNSNGVMLRAFEPQVTERDYKFVIPTLKLPVSKVIPYAGRAEDVVALLAKQPDE